MVQGPITHVATIPGEEEGVQGPSTRPGRPPPLTRGVASDPAISRWDILYFRVVTHCTENPIYVFPEMKLRGLGTRHLYLIDLI